MFAEIDKIINDFSKLGVGEGSDDTRCLNLLEHLRHASLQVSRVIRSHIEDPEYKTTKGFNDVSKAVDKYGEFSNVFEKFRDQVVKAKSEGKLDYTWIANELQSMKSLLSSSLEPFNPKA